MSDSEQEKTEAPTPKKREEASTEGRVPRSQELTTALLLVTAAFVLAQLGPGLGHTLVDIFGSGLASAGAELDRASAVALVQSTGWQVLLALGVMLATIAGAALLVGAAQARGTWSTKALAPKWGKINPMENGKRMLGSQPWADLAKSLLKLTLVSMVVYSVLRSAWGDILALAQQSPLGVLEVVQRYGVRLLFTAGLSYLALAAMDYAYQLWEFEKSLRMTKEEIKQEMKQSEGDPMIKARRRSAARQLARRQMFTEVPKADVVIANPTHIAIAIRYDPRIAPAPIVVAMGKRKVAERIKKLAFDSGVPVIENRPLARALIASARLGQLIPVELYAAVAEILAFVIRQRAARGSTWEGSATA